MSFIFSTYEDYSSENDFGKVDWEKEAFEKEKEVFMKEKEAFTKENEDFVKEKDAFEKEKEAFEKEKEAFMKEKEAFVKEEMKMEKHCSSNFDSWVKKSPSAASPNVRSIVSDFLKTIPNETVYTIHSISLKDYGNSWGGNQPVQVSELNIYIATHSKVYMMHLDGDINGNYRINSTSVFKEIVKFSSKPTLTFWRAVFSQMGQEDNFTISGQATREIYLNANAKLEALFKSF